MSQHVEQSTRNRFDAESDHAVQQKRNDGQDEEKVGDCLRFKREASNQGGNQKTFLICQKHLATLTENNERRKRTFFISPRLQ